MSEFIIRPAEPRDLEVVNTLLGQVLSVHHASRPDLFRPVGKKYTDEELLSIFKNPDTPVFVYDREGSVLGYAFCVIRHQESGALKPLKTLYLDDLCVLDSARGLHIGTSLFDYVKAFAKKKGCHNITLHVWEGNLGAKAFYKALGMVPQFTSMELLCK